MKRLGCIFVALVLIFCSALPVNAAQNMYVNDEIGLFTTAEAQNLNGILEDLSEHYGMIIAIAAVQSLDGRKVQSYTDDFYDRQYGPDTDGILLLLAIEDRELCISTLGLGRKLLTDAEVGESLDSVLHYFSDDQYSSGFHAWIRELPGWLDASEPEPQPSIWIALIIGLIVAAITLLIMKSTMNSKRRQHSAQHYLTPGSYHLRTQQDIFLYSNVTKTPRPKDNGSSSGSRGHGGGSRSF